MNVYAHVSVTRDDGKPQMYQGVCLVSMDVSLYVLRLTAVSALCIMVHVTCGMHVISTGC